MLIAFVPVCAALTVSFFAIRSAVSDLVNAGLRQNLRENQEAVETVRVGAEARCQKLIASLKDHPAMRAATGALADGEDATPQAVNAAEKQLSILNRTLQFDALILSSAGRKSLAGVQRLPEGEKPLKGAFLPGVLSGGSRELADLERGVYEFVTVPIEIGSEPVAYLSAGQKFDARTYAGAGHAVLLRDGVIAQSGVPAVENGTLEKELAAKCANTGLDCEVGAGGDTFLVTNIAGDGKSRYRVLNLQSMDRASQRFLHEVLKVFTVVAVATLALVFVLSLLGSQSVAKPLAGLLSTLRHAQETGQLRGGLQTRWGTAEVDQLAEAFNQAAESIAGKQKELDKAYHEFVESMARTLDARDPYTAGHSLRVAHYSRAVGAELGLPERDLEVIETGARLHDIGKIGIPDAVLQKAGRLTDDEFKIIKMHPQIGKRMLKRVGGFEAYLPVIEYHHENHDGTGYPYGMRGKDIPLSARIVHVADAYDAMTSHRTYRKAMPHEKALQILRRCGGTQFDPEVVHAFAKLFPADKSPINEKDLPIQMFA